MQQFKPSASNTVSLSFVANKRFETVSFPFVMKTGVIVSNEEFTQRELVCVYGLSHVLLPSLSLSLPSPSPSPSVSVCVSPSVCLCLAL